MWQRYIQCDEGDTTTQSPILLLHAIHNCIKCASLRGDDDDGRCGCSTKLRLEKSVDGEVIACAGLIESQMKKKEKKQGECRKIQQREEKRKKLIVGILLRGELDHLKKK